MHNEKLNRRDHLDSDGGSGPWSEQWRTRLAVGYIDATYIIMSPCSLIQLDNARLSPPVQ